MSFPLPSVDLTGASAGQTGTISLNNVGISAGGVTADPSTTKNQATIFFFNDSGCGLQLLFPQGTGFNLPAGAWAPIPLPPGANSIAYSVLYALPSPPVSKLLMTYYAPGEPLPQSMNLGNSPVGIGGVVQTSSIQTLSNESSASGLLVIDMGDSPGFSQIFTLYNDGHCLWAVDQGGTKHQVIKVQTSANPLQLGQAADTTEVLGNLTVDGTVLINGTTSLNAQNGAIIHQGANTTIDASQAANVVINAPGVNGNINFQHNGTQDFHSGPGLWLDSGSVNLLTGSFSRISKFTGTSASGSVTVSHGLGAVPDLAFVAWNLTSTPSPHLIGCDLNNATSTQINVWADLAGVAFYGVAIKF